MPAAGAVYCDYDAVGRMTQADAETSGLGTSYYEYDARGQATKKKLGNGCYTYFSYDAAGRTTRILNCLSDGSALAYFGMPTSPVGPRGVAARTGVWMLTVDDCRRIHMAVVVGFRGDASWSAFIMAETAMWGHCSLCRGRLPSDSGTVYGGTARASRMAPVRKRCFSVWSGRIGHAWRQGRV